MKINIIINALAALFFIIIATFTIRYIEEENYLLIELFRDVSQYGLLIYVLWMPFFFGVHAHPEYGSEKLFETLTQYNPDYFMLMLALYQCKSKTFMINLMFFLVYMVMVNKEHDIYLLAQLVGMLAILSGLCALVGWTVVSKLHKEGGNTLTFSYSNTL